MTTNELNLKREIRESRSTLTRANNLLTDIEVLLLNHPNDPKLLKLRDTAKAVFDQAAYILRTYIDVQSEIESIEE